MEHTNHETRAAPGRPPRAPDAPMSGPGRAHPKRPGRLPDRNTAAGRLRTAVDPDAPAARPLPGERHAATGRLRIAVDPDAPAARPLAGERHAATGRLRIAVDFDGVLFDHTPYVLRGFRDAHGIDLQEEGLRYWDFFQYRAVREKNLTWSCVRAVLHAIDTDHALHELPPRDAHARAVMERWREAGHEVLVVTAREETARATTEAFLRRNAIPHDALVMGASRKTGYDVLVDDAPHNVLMAAADGGLALLMDHPYNRDVPTKRNPLRVRNWREVETSLARHLAAAEAPA